MLSVPRNTTARILYALILKRKVSLVDFPTLAGFRTRISELSLEYNVKLFHEFKKGVNMFGNSFHYKVHFLPDEEVQHAIDVYNRINVSKKKSECYNASK